MRAYVAGLLSSAVVMALLSTACSDETSAAESSSSGGGSSGSSNGSSGILVGSGEASLLRSGDAALVHIRLEDSQLTFEDDATARWRLRNGDQEIPLDRREAGVRAVRRRNDSAALDAVYFQVHTNAQVGDTLLVEHVPSGRQWSFAARETPARELVLNPILVRGAGGTQLESAEMSKLATAWEPVRAACAIELSIRPAREITVEAPEQLFRGVAALDDEERPADIVLPRQIDALLDDAGAPDDELRLILTQRVRSLALPKMLYELGGTYYYEASVALYDSFDEDSGFVGLQPATGSRYRFAIAADTAPMDAELPWTAAVDMGAHRRARAGAPPRTQSPRSNR